MKNKNRRNDNEQARDGRRAPANGDLVALATSTDGTGGAEASTSPTAELSPLRSPSPNDLIAYARHQVEKAAPATPNEPRSVMTPPNIPDYRIDRLLGRGGMGSVYLACDLTLDTPVAIKVPHSLREEAKKQFLAEAATLAKVKHPHVVPVLKAGSLDDSAYFVMEYIDGCDAQTLVRRFAEHAPHELPADQLAELTGIDETIVNREVGRILQGKAPYYRLVASWIAGAADGLQQCHKENILHRDMKPNNLILSKNGSMLVVDFGLARSTSEQPGKHASGVTGTHAYTAPEKVIGDWAKVDQRADVWALGATMYELLTYCRAYPRPGVDVLQDIASTDPTPPRDIINHIPKGLESICLKAMQRDPRERFSSAAEMADALHGWMGSEKPVRKGRATTFAIAAVALLAAIAIVAAVIGLDGRTDHKPLALITEEIAPPPTMADDDIDQEEHPVVSTNKAVPPIVATATDTSPLPASPIVYLDLSTDGQVERTCPDAGERVTNKFYDVRTYKALQALSFVTLEDETVRYKVVGTVSADFPGGVPRDGDFGLCEATVSFKLYKREPHIAGATWVPMQNERYYESDSYHILPSCAAINDKLRALSNNPISRILALIEIDRQAG